MSVPTDQVIGTPNWLLTREIALCPCGCIGKRRKGSYTQKTINSAADLLRQVMFSDDTAAPNADCCSASIRDSSSSRCSDLS